jgi:hypothetical protein
MSLYFACRHYPAFVCGVGNPARNRLLGGFFAQGAHFRSRGRRLKAGGSQDWLPQRGGCTDVPQF